MLRESKVKQFIVPPPTSPAGRKNEVRGIKCVSAPGHGLAGTSVQKTQSVSAHAELFILLLKYAQRVQGQFIVIICSERPRLNSLLL